MSRWMLLMLLLGLLGCAAGPQPFLDASQKPVEIRHQDVVECQALAGQAALGAGIWSGDPAIQSYVFDQTRQQYLLHCLESRGWQWMNPVR